MDRKTIWEQFVDRKAEFIGGTLIDLGDGDPIADAFHPLPEDGARTKIVDMVYRENGGPDHHYFAVEGEDFGCGGDTRYLGIVGASRYGDGFECRVAILGGHEWHFVKGQAR